MTRPTGPPKTLECEFDLVGLKCSPGKGRTEMDLHLRLPSGRADVVSSFLAGLTKDEFLKLDLSPVMPAVDERWSGHVKLKGFGCKAKKGSEFPELTATVALEDRETTDIRAVILLWLKMLEEGSERALISMVRVQELLPLGPRSTNGGA